VIQRIIECLRKMKKRRTKLAAEVRSGQRVRHAVALASGVQVDARSNIQPGYSDGSRLTSSRVASSAALSTTCVAVRLSASCSGRLAPEPPVGVPGSYQGMLVWISTWLRACQRTRTGRAASAMVSEFTSLPLP
jgi:hypothetical protein